MSLQGSLETFALPDVLVLLASTKKSGELRVQGGRADGRVWVQAGEIVQTQLSGKDFSSLDTVFELLRIAEGSFVFAGEESAPAPHEPEMIDGVLVEAQARLGEWREIEKVVPHLDAVLDMAAEAPSREVTVTADQWRMLVAVAGGRSVAELMERISGNEFDTCKAVKGLVESRLVTLDTTAKPRPEPASAPPAPKPATAAQNGSAGRRPAAAEERHSPPPSASNGSRDQGPTGGPSTTPPRPRVRASTTTPGTVRAVTSPPRPAAGSGGPKPEAVRNSASGVTPNVAEGQSGPGQGPNPSAPSPKAGSRSPEAQALVAQLAALNNDDEPEAAAAAEQEGDADAGADGPKGEEDEHINRGLLLKFLSSVRN